MRPFVALPRREGAPIAFSARPSTPGLARAPPPSRARAPGSTGCRGDRADVVAGAAERRRERQRRDCTASRPRAGAPGWRRWGRRTACGRRARRPAGRRADVDARSSSGCSGARGVRRGPASTLGSSRHRAARGESARAHRPARTPGPERRVRVHALARRGSAGGAAGRPRGRGSVGIAFSIPITVISTSGSVGAHTAVALRLDDADGAGVGGSRSSRREIATRARRNASRRACPPPRARPRGRPRGPATAEAGSRNRSRISARFLWIAGTSKCDGRSPASWMISSARSVSSGRMPAPSSASLSRISSVVERLHLDDLVDALGLHERGDRLVRLGRVARPVHGASGGLHGRLEPDQDLVEPVERLVLDRRPRRAKELPVGNLSHDGPALRANRLGRVPDVRAHGAIREGGRCLVREALGTCVTGGGARGFSLSPGFLALMTPAPRRGARDARSSPAAAARRRCASGRSCRRRRRSPLPRRRSPPASRPASRPRRRRS